jgi:hypothetical protein
MIRLADEDIQEDAVIRPGITLRDFQNYKRLDDCTTRAMTTNKRRFR